MLPDLLLTLSSCLTELLPDAWALAWSSCSESQRIAAIEKLGLSPEVLPALVRSTTDAFDRGELGWPSVWQSSSSARAALARWFGATTEFMILELGVPEDVAAALLAELAPRPREGESGFYASLKSHRPLEATGAPLGWELLGAESGFFHSWFCNALQDEAAARLGIRPGELGLLPTEDEARAVAALIESGLGAEPVPWFPGLLRRIA